MRSTAVVALWLILLVPWILGAQAARTGVETLRTPPLTTSLLIGDQRVSITAWGVLAMAPAGIVGLTLTADLGDLQRNLAALLASELNRSDRCGERLRVEGASLVPAAPASLLEVALEYERFGCVKAFGKEVVKRLVGGHGVIDVKLTPRVESGGISLDADVVRIDAGGSLGELLRSGSLGASLKQKIAARIQSAVQKATELESTLPPEISSAARLRDAHFSADAAGGRLLFSIEGEVRLSPNQLRLVRQQLGQN